MGPGSPTNRSRFVGVPLGGGTEAVPTPAFSLHCRHVEIGVEDQASQSRPVRSGRPTPCFHEGRGRVRAYREVSATLQLCVGNEQERLPHPQSSVKRASTGVH